MVGNQIVNLTPCPSFGHNLCFKCPNGSCEPILDIYVPRAFQWYKEIFHSMGFDPYNHSLKIWESIGTPIPKMRAHLGVWGFIPSHFPTFMGAWDVTPRLPSWPAPLQALALVANLRLGLWHKTYNVIILSILKRALVCDHEVHTCTSFHLSGLNLCHNPPFNMKFKK
jgi:hypothetical protein